MKAVETSGMIDAEGDLRLDRPLGVAGPGRVRVIVLFPEEQVTEQEWLQAAARNPVFDVLNDPAEDIYTRSDGRPFRDEG